MGNVGNIVTRTVNVINFIVNPTIDQNFMQGAGGFNGSTKALITQSDGKILVGGNFTSYSGVSLGHIARLNSDGSIDTSFVIGTGFNGEVNTLAIQNDGKILVE